MREGTAGRSGTAETRFVFPMMDCCCSSPLNLPGIDLSCWWGQEQSYRDAARANEDAGEDLRTEGKFLNDGPRTGKEDSVTVVSC